MRFYSFEVVIEKEAEDEGYFAWSPSLPGCVSSGPTIEDTKRGMREAVTQHVTALLEQGSRSPRTSGSFTWKNWPSAFPRDAIASGHCA